MARKTFQSIIIVLILMVASAFFGYLLRLSLARSISQADYGMFYAIFAFLGIFAIFKDVGLNRTLAKFLPEYLLRKNYKDLKATMIIVLLIQLAVSTIVTLLFFAFSNYLALHYFHDASAAFPFKIMAVVFWIYPFENIFRFSFQGFQNMTQYALVDFLKMLLILVFVLLLMGLVNNVMLPVYAYLIAQILIPIIFAIIFFRYVFPEFFRTKAKLTKALARKVLLFGLPTMFGLVGTIIIAYTDTIVLTYFRPITEVALYQAGQPTAKLLLYVTEATAMVILPLSSELWASRQKQKLQEKLSIIQKYLFVVIIPAALVLFSFPGLVLGLLFGQQYTGGAIVLQFLAIGAIIYTVAYINTTVMIGIGQPKMSTYIILTGALANLVLNLLMIPEWGLFGAVLATVISYFIILVLSVIKIRPFIRLDIHWSEWVKTIIAGFAFLGLIFVIKELLNINPWLEMVICVVVAGLAYLGLLFAFRIVQKREIADFLRELRFLKQ